MEVIECESDEFAANDTCSVCVVEDFKFRAVDPPAMHGDQRSNFCEWWPRAARSVISGLYGDNETRRSAAKALMGLVDDFPYEKVVDVECLTHEAITLSDLYRTRLMYEEQHMRSVREKWAERISLVVSKGGVLIKESVRAREGLRDASNRMRRKFEATQQVDAIVNDELRRAERRLAKDVESEMRVLRAEALSDVVVRPPDTRHIDERIASLANRMVLHNEEPIVEALREAYHGHTQNKMSAAAAELRSHAERDWMQALR